MTDDERPIYGTADRDAPVPRADFERAVRSLNLSDLELRDALLQLAARVVALTDALTRRLDGVEPVPAPPGTPAPPPTGTLEAAVEAGLEPALAQIRVADTRTRVSLELIGDKYRAAAADVPCAELIPLCGARCCQLSFALSTEDLDEGVIRWDYGQPYLIRQRASDGFCVHNDPASRGCTVHAHRPRVCRTYDCRADSRVWLDYARRVPAPARRDARVRRSAAVRARRARPLPRRRGPRRDGRDQRDVRRRRAAPRQAAGLGWGLGVAAVARPTIMPQAARSRASLGRAAS